MRERLRRRGTELVALLLSPAQIPPYFGYLTDDSYIYARFAWNLAHHGSLVFNLGEPVHAATSPLWAILGAVGEWLGVGAFPFLKALGWLAGAAALWILVRVSRRLLPSTPWVLAAAVLLATEPWFVRWSGSGMETPLAVLLLAVTAEAALRPVQEVAWGRLGSALGLGILVRPELVLLAGILAAAALLDRRARGRTRMGLGLALPLAVWAAFAVPFYGTFFPETLQAKSTPLGLRLGRLLGNLRVLVLQVGLAAPLPLLGLALRRRSGGLFGERPLLVWLLALPVVYLLRDVQVVSRYLEVLLPVLLLLGLPPLARRSRIWLGGAAAQACLALLLTSLWIAPSTAAFSRSAGATLGEIGRWLRENTAEDEVVAIYDIGLVGYLSHRPILDLGGLVNPPLNDLRDRMDDEEILLEGRFLRFGRPRWLVDRRDRPRALAGAVLGDYRLQPILDGRVDNLGLTRPEPLWYTLYRLDPVPSR